MPYLSWSENDHLYVPKFNIVLSCIFFALYLVSVLHFGFRTVS